MYSREVGRPCGGCGVSVFNNYRQLIRWLFCIIGAFLFFNHANSVCTVIRRTFLRKSLTMLQDALSHHALMWGDAFSKRQVDLVDDRALYAQGLVDQPTHLKVWGLYRPPSFIRSGTGRPACPFDSLGTVPTTELYTLGDGSTSMPIRVSGDCTDH